MNERDVKITMYKALRTVKDKLDKGQLMLLDDNQKPMLTEMIFVITRVANAIVIADQDEDLWETKDRLDQQIPARARI